MTVESLDTVVIAAAGAGSRMAPLSKAVPKELLPLGLLPILHLVAVEAIDGGAKRIVVVSSESKPAIGTYVDEVLRPEVATPAGVSIQVVAQGEIPGTGGATLTAQTIVGDSPFLVVWGDEVFLGPSRCGELIEAWNEHEKPCIGLTEVTDEEVPLCGIAVTERSLEGVLLVRELVEKPDPPAIQSRLASVGGVVLTTDLVEVLRSTPRSTTGELVLSDAISRYAAHKPVVGVRITADWHEAGSPQGYIRAFARVVSDLRETRQCPRR